MAYILGLPEFLVIHFSRTEVNGRIVKKHIVNELTLDMKEFAITEKDSTDNTKYNLYSVVVHDGDTSYSGHYISYVKYGEQ